MHFAVAIGAQRGALLDFREYARFGRFLGYHTADPGLPRFLAFDMVKIYYVRAVRK